MKQIRITALFLCFILLQVNCVSAQHMSQKEYNTISINYQAALTILQGAVASDLISGHEKGYGFVYAGLADKQYLLDSFKNYNLSGYSENIGNKSYAVLLLCDKNDKYALLEGVFCGKKPFIENVWKDEPERQCNHTLDIAKVCQ